jgi:hypothetical protein
MRNNVFVYLYPEVDILESEVDKIWTYFETPETKALERIWEKSKDSEEKKRLAQKAQEISRRMATQFYSTKLGECINQRYRQKGFSIFYALLDARPISPLIKVQEGDRIVSVGMTVQEHRTKKPGIEEYSYPDQDCILKQLGNPQVLRVGRFHMWACVERLAKRAYEKGVDVLVDEDLTEFFGFDSRQQGFRTDNYPTKNPRNIKNGSDFFERFMEARKNKPWLWQGY